MLSLRGPSRCNWTRHKVIRGHNGRKGWMAAILDWKPIFGFRDVIGPKEAHILLSTIGRESN